MGDDGKYFIIPNSFADEPLRTLTGGAVKVYLLLRLHFNRAKGKAWPGVALLARRTDQSAGTVSRQLAELAAAGLIIRLRRGSRRKRESDEWGFPTGPSDVDYTCASANTDGSLFAPAQEQLTTCAGASCAEQLRQRKPTRRLEQDDSIPSASADGPAADAATAPGAADVEDDEDLDDEPYRGDQLPWTWVEADRLADATPGCGGKVSMALKGVVGVACLCFSRGEQRVPLRLISSPRPARDGEELRALGRRRAGRRLPQLSHHAHRLHSRRRRPGAPSLRRPAVHAQPDRQRDGSPPPRSKASAPTRTSRAIGTSIGTRLSRRRITGLPSPPVTIRPSSKTASFPAAIWPTAGGSPRRTSVSTSGTCTTPVPAPSTTTRRRTISLAGVTKTVATTGGFPTPRPSRATSPGPATSPLRSREPNGSFGSRSSQPKASTWVPRLAFKLRYQRSRAESSSLSPCDFHRVPWRCVELTMS